MSTKPQNGLDKVRGIAYGFVIALMALIGMAYGVLGGITLCTVVFTRLDNTIHYRLLLTAGGTMGGVVGAISSVCFWLVVYGLVVTVRDMMREARKSPASGEDS